MVVVAYKILLSAQGPLVLGFCVLGLRVLGQGLTTMGTPRIKIINSSIFWTSCVYDMTEGIGIIMMCPIIHNILIVTLSGPGGWHLSHDIRAQSQ